MSYKKLTLLSLSLSLFLSIQSLSNFFLDIHRQTSRVTSFRSLSSPLVIKRHGRESRPNRFNRPLLLLRQRFSQISLYIFPPLYRIFHEWAHKHGCKPRPVSTPNPIPGDISQRAVGHRIGRASQINGTIKLGRERVTFIRKVGDDLSAKRNYPCIGAVIFRDVLRRHLISGISYARAPLRATIKLE